MDGGDGWFLYIQYNDNTISHFCGYGGFEDEFPNSYEFFKKELTEFTDLKKI